MGLGGGGGGGGHPRTLPLSLLPTDVPYYRDYVDPLQGRSRVRHRGRKAKTASRLHRIHKDGQLRQATGGMVWSIISSRQVAFFGGCNVLLCDLKQTACMEVAAELCHC